MRVPWTALAGRLVLEWMVELVMPQIKLIEHNGTEHSIEVPVGTSIMQGAVNNMVPGIVGDCGGSCSCATCHAYVQPQWAEKLAPADEAEQAMLEGVLDLRPNSRLTCQIIIQPELEGLTVELPASQY